MKLPANIPWRVIGGAGALAAVLVGLFVWFFNNTSTQTHKKPPEIVQIHVLPPPPPPPPPPPKPKIEQPKIKPQMMKTPQPPKDPTPSAPALDAKGAGPGDAFGLAGHQGGSDYVGGGGGGGDPFGWYATMIQQRMQDVLTKQRKLYGALYQVPVKVWLSNDGVIERVEVAKSTGKADIDQLLKATLESMQKLPEAPPKGLPQPVSIKVTAL